eukprot:TRINITY_DN8228_c0_g1_i1.p1 TRINITY_DN8228_c0_g1~~TRINITY_DN8228_c0_g1_i1.p1  ORF type:complete len:540 (+),score=83.21 TRINITY_DN8228_c0_g1_i1:172-1791(+)
MVQSCENHIGNVSTFTGRRQAASAVRHSHSRSLHQFRGVACVCLFSLCCGFQLPWKPISFAQLRLPLAAARNSNLRAAHIALSATDDRQALSAETRLLRDSIASLVAEVRLLREVLTARASPQQDFEPALPKQQPFATTLPPRAAAEPVARPASVAGTPAASFQSAARPSSVSEILSSSPPPVTPSLLGAQLRNPQGTPTVKATVPSAANPFSSAARPQYPQGASEVTAPPPSPAASAAMSTQSPPGVSKVTAPLASAASSQVQTPSQSSGVGTTKVVVVSAGHDGGDIADFFLDDKPIPISGIENRRGLNVVVIDPEKKLVESAGTYDVWGNPGTENKRFASDIDRLPKGRIVMVALKDSGMEKLDMRAMEALEDIGSTLEDRLGFREGYALIGEKFGKKFAEATGAAGSNRKVMINAEFDFKVQARMAPAPSRASGGVGSAGPVASPFQAPSRPAATPQAPPPAPAAPSQAAARPPVSSPSAADDPLKLQRDRLQKDMLEAAQRPPSENDGRGKTWQEVLLMLTNWERTQKEARSNA